MPETLDSGKSAAFLGPSGTHFFRCGFQVNFRSKRVRFLMRTVLKFRGLTRYQLNQQLLKYHRPPFPARSAFTRLSSHSGANRRCSNRQAGYFPLVVSRFRVRRICFAMAPSLTAGYRRYRRRDYCAGVPLNQRCARCATLAEHLSYCAKRRKQRKVARFARKRESGDFRHFDARRQCGLPGAI